MKKLMLCSILSVLFFNTYSQDSKLKAVLIVGDLQDETLEAIFEMKKISEFFLNNKVMVSTFYYPNTNWNEIVEACNQANFLVYNGHGIKWGDGKYGGFSLNKSISSDDIINDLKLSNNALIIFKSVCGGAGSSAGDSGDIGSRKALKRVIDYASPFFKTGASAYYANNYTGGCISFLKDFFKNKIIKDCFESSIVYSASIHIEKYYKYNDKSVAIAGAEGDGNITLIKYENNKRIEQEVPAYKRYSIAYVANSQYSLSNLKSK